MLRRGAAVWLALGDQVEFVQFVDILALDQLSAVRRVIVDTAKIVALAQGPALDCKRAVIEAIEAVDERGAPARRRVRSHALSPRLRLP